MRTVTIGLLTLNHLSFTQLCLEYLFKNTDYPYELVIVDQNSSDGTKEYLQDIERTYGSIQPITVHYMDRNVGVAAGLNICALHNLDNDLVFLQNDVVVGPNWLSPLVSLADSSNKIGMVGSFLSPEVNFIDTKCTEETRRKYEQEIMYNLRNDPTKERLKEYLNYFYDGDFDEFALDFVERNKDTLPYDEIVFMMSYFKKETFKAVGYFDERYWPYGGEEWSFMYRVNNVGLFRLLCNQSFAHHWVSNTCRKLLRDDHELYMKDIPTGELMATRWEMSKAHGGEVWPGRSFEAGTIVKRSHAKWRLKEGIDSTIKVTRNGITGYEALPAGSYFRE